MRKRISIKIALTMLTATIGVLFFGCGKGTTADPETLTKDALNPPGNLFTVTKSAEIELRWTTGNAEDEFKGYFVFGTTKTFAELKALVKYPTGAADKIDRVGIPRCVDNSKFFEAFGLKATDRKCEGGEPEKFLLADEAAAAEKLENYLQCGANTDKNPSVVVTSGISTEIQKCAVKKAYDATTGAQVSLANGTVYSFMVVSVKGSDLTEVSWTSNVVEDAPSATALTGSAELSNYQFTKITFNLTAATAAFSTTVEDCTGTGDSSASTDGRCGLSQQNANAVTEPTIFLGRAQSANSYVKHPQRLYISVSSQQTGDAIALQARGPQTLDKKEDGGDDSKVPRIARDEPVTTYATAGIKEIVYNNQVFDFQITKGTDVYYGKVVIGDVTYADDNESKATVEVNVVMQPGKNIVHYLQ